MFHGPLRRFLREIAEQFYAVQSGAHAVVVAPNHDREVLARLRHERSRLVIDEIRKWLFAKKAEALPRSALAKAVNYTLDRWTELTRFLNDVRIPLDNNASERALRGPVIGRKVHYGSKSQRGTEVAALFYTLCESAKLVGVDAKAYIRNELNRALGGERPLLPREFKAAVTSPS